MNENEVTALNPSAVSMAEFQAMTQEMFQKKRVLDEIDKTRDAASLELEKLKQKVLGLMVDLGIKTFPLEGYGKITVRKEIRVSMPSNPENKEAFFGYLKDKNLFENLASINYATLNAWYRQEVESRITIGDVDFRVPGLDEPKTNEYIVIGK